MTPEPRDIIGKLLTEEEAKRIAERLNRWTESMTKWLREPEQWRRLMADTSDWTREDVTALLADRQARIEREKRVLGKLESVRSMNDPARMGAVVADVLSLLNP